MAKSEVTLQLEESIYRATQKQGTFGCFEVTIGWFGSERVDYLTYDTKGTWRCYEIKASVKDFRSPAAKTFIGHFNYFVMPQEVYNAVHNEIPDGIGVIVNGASLIRAKRRKLKVEESILYGSMIRSLSREYQAHRRSQDRLHMDMLNRGFEEARRSRQRSDQRYRELVNAIINKHGVDFLRELKCSMREDDTDD
jgi:hypothetical protein